MSRTLLNFTAVRLFPSRALPPTTDSAGHDKGRVAQLVFEIQLGTKLNQRRQLVGDEMQEQFERQSEKAVRHADLSAIPYGFTGVCHGGQVQRRVALLVLRVNGGVVLQQDLGALAAVGPGRVVQRRQLQLVHCKVRRE